MFEMKDGEALFRVIEKYKNNSRFQQNYHQA